MLVRWQAYLSRTRRDHDPIFSIWHALAALPHAEFPSRAGPVIAQIMARTDSVQTINPVVARVLADESPRSLADTARIYARVLLNVELIWQDVERRAMLEGRTPGPVPDPALESLRQVFHGRESPVEVRLDPFGDLALLPDRPSQARFQELRNAVQTWLTSGAGAPARALSLEDSPIPIEPRVFLRGNPNNLSEAVAPPVPLRSRRSRLKALWRRAVAGSSWRGPSPVPTTR